MGLTNVIHKILMKFNRPVCPIHNHKMYLLKGHHRESGGFAGNYWYCGRHCKYTLPARNRTEAEELSGWQKTCDKYNDAKVLLKIL